MPISDYLARCTGVIHVGAGNGGERFVYDQYPINVLWFEPDPTTFEQLQVNIKSFRKQKAFQYLVMTLDDVNYQFNVADNGGASSSALDLSGHKEAWPNVHYVSSLPVKSISLNTFFKRYSIVKEDYQALVIDTQGTELNVLRGASEILSGIKYAEIEVTDFSAYKDGATAEEINAFMEQSGFKLMKQELQCSAEVGNGKCYDYIYERNS